MEMPCAAALGSHDIAHMTPGTLYLLKAVPSVGPTTQMQQFTSVQPVKLVGDPQPGHGS